MKLSNSILCLLGLFLSANSFSQDQFDHTPLSPQFEAFKQYGEINVNLSTGVPNISIPLLEIEHYGYKLPLSLDYFPSPLKPGYNYDVFGFGWNHSFRSHISRKINYLPDERNQFIVQSTSAGYRDFSCLATKNFAPDIFSATLPDGSNIEFTIEKHGHAEAKAYITNGRPVKINWNRGTSNLVWLEITDENGIKYKFADTNNPDAVSGVFQEWHLTEIILPWTQKPIRFFYDTRVKVKHPRYLDGFYIKNVKTVSGFNAIYECMWDDDDKYSSHDYDMLLLTRVEFRENSYIRYKYEEEYYWGQGGQNLYNYIEKIELYSNSSSLVKIIEFETLKKNYNSQDPNLLLAQLKKLSVEDPNGVNTSTQYGFEYGELTPDFHPNYLDHWGYMNKSSGSHLGGVSNFVFYSPAMPHHLIQNVIKLENRSWGLHKYQMNAHLGTAPGKPGGFHGVLKSIVYPTKGRTEFEFERHKFLTKNGADGNYIIDSKKWQVAEASGFRIKTITNKDINGTELGKKSYMYGQRHIEIWHPDLVAVDPNIVDDYMKGAFSNQHTGVGEGVVDPNLLTFTTFKKNMFPFSLGRDDYYVCQSYMIDLGLTPDMDVFEVMVKGEYTGDQFYWKGEFDINISSSNFQRLLDGRPQVLYPYVTVYEGEYNSNQPNSTAGINGKTEYVFDLLMDYKGYGDYGPVNGMLHYKLLEKMPRSSDNKIFVEPVFRNDHFNYYESKSYKYNDLLNKREFAIRNGNYVLVREEINTWGASSHGNRTVYAYEPAIPQRAADEHVLQNAGFNHDCYLARACQEIRSDFYDKHQLTSRWVNTYDDIDSYLSSNEYYNYFSGRRISDSGVLNSDGTSNTTTYSYPACVAPPPGIIKEMCDRNIISQVVKSKTFSGQTPIAGDSTEFKQFTGGIMPSKIFQLETFKPDSSEYYFFGEILHYSKNGRPLEMVTKDGTHSCYIWGYKDSYPVAKVINGSHNQIAHSSFEEPTMEGMGSWSYNVSASFFTEDDSYTGKKSYKGTSISKSGLSSGTYIVSYMARKSGSGNGSVTINGSAQSINTNQWVYKEIELTNITSVQLNLSGVYLDELRLYPKGAQMTTYTHYPLVGMTSQTDPRGLTTRYEYDGFGRLKRVIDHEGKVLQEHDYNYAKQE